MTKPCHHPIPHVSRCRLVPSVPRWPYVLPLTPDHESLLAMNKLLSLASLAVAISACAAATDAEASDNDVISTALVPGSFKLYLSPNEKRNPSCDLHTALTIDNAHGATASLRQALDGTCELAVFPNERSYPLNGKDVGCGTRVYTG